MTPFLYNHFNFGICRLTSNNINNKNFLRWIVLYLNLQVLWSFQTTLEIYRYRPRILFSSCTSNTWRCKQYLFLLSVFYSILKKWRMTKKMISAESKLYHNESFKEVLCRLMFRQRKKLGDSKYLTISFFRTCLLSKDS